MVVPFAIAVALFEYRLYDIDRLLNRTLVYGLLTALLAGVYASVVLILGVDRRFNRRKYDAARTVEAFSVRLRDEVDLDALAAELLLVADQTMQPTTVSLWLGPTPQPPPHGQ